MSNKDRQLPSAIDITSLQILKPEGGTRLVVIPEPENGNSIFANLNLVESIFQTGITGLLKIKDPSVVGDEFNFVGNEIVVIEMKSPEPIEDSEQRLELCVSNVRFLGDEAQEAISGASGRAGAGWELDLVSCEGFLLDTDILSYMDNDFIGPIADDEGEGFVNKVAEKLLNKGTARVQDDMFVQPTDNAIWLKKNHMMYPWGKDTHSPNLLNIMNNICENATCDEGKGVNFLFWQDLRGYHFRSIRNIIQESDTTWGFFFGENNVREYYITDKNIPSKDWKHGDPRIESFRIAQEYDHFSALQNGAYSSYYELVKPNYDDPYFEYLDFTTSHMKSGAEKWGEREIIDYDYHREIEGWGMGENEGGMIEEFRLIPESFETSIDVSDPTNIDYKSRRIYDETNAYGYFSSPYNYYGEKDIDFMGSEYTQGKYGKRNDILWQTMFDQTDLDHKILKIIQTEIKEPLRENYKQYVEMQNLKEKFKVYKKSICCDKEDMEKYTFLAVIDDAVKIQDNGRTGIYEYSWREVEMWPRDHIEENEGEVVTPEGAPITVVAIEGGMQGTISEDEKINPAYNVNELMNTDEGDDVFAGPGINLADEDFNDYPEAFQMMPVGGYFRIGDDPCEFPEVGESGVHFHKHIVQMYRIPSYVLETIVPAEDEEDPEIPTEIYLFDVPNAHDGLCSCP